MELVKALHSLLSLSCHVSRVRTKGTRRDFLDSLPHFCFNIVAELCLAYSYATGVSEERRTLMWSFTILVSAGVEKLAAMRAYEQMIEKGYLSTLEVDPRRRLQQIRSLISMLEAFDSMANVQDLANDSSEVRKEQCHSSSFSPSLPHQC